MIILLVAVSYVHAIVQNVLDMQNTYISYQVVTDG